MDVHAEDVHEDEEMEGEGEGQEDEDYDPEDVEEDEYLNKFINKKSLVGTRLGGNQVSLDQAGHNLFHLYLFYRSSRRLTGLRDL